MSSPFELNSMTIIFEKKKNNSVPLKSPWRVSPPVPWAASSGTEMVVRLLAPQEQPAAIHSLWSNQSCQTMCKAAMLISFLRTFPVPGGKHHTMFRSIFFNWHKKLKRSLLIAWYILITLASGVHDFAYCKATWVHPHSSQRTNLSCIFWFIFLLPFPPSFLLPFFLSFFHIHLLHKYIKLTMFFPSSSEMKNFLVIKKSLFKKQTLGSSYILKCHFKKSSSIKVDFIFKYMF